MFIIEIEAQENGAHRNLRPNYRIDVPVGWAVVPDSIEVPDTFPFVDVEVEGQTVTGMTAGVVPAADSTEEPTQLDRIEAQVTYTAMMTDTLLEV